MKYHGCVYKAVNEYHDNKLSTDDIDAMDSKDVLRYYFLWEGISTYYAMIAISILLETQGE